MIAKQGIPLPFGGSLDTKTDRWQVAPGNFLALSNIIFLEDKRFTKRNGFGYLTPLPSGASPLASTTFKGALTVLGKSIYSYSSENSQWTTIGKYIPCKLSIQPLVRTAYSQANVDAAYHSSGFVCTTFLDGDGNYKYQVSSSTTSAAVTGITTLPSTATAARVFALGNFFVITFLATVAATPHVQFIAIPVYNPTSPTAATDISTQLSSLSGGYDGCVYNNNLYLAWDGSDGGGAFRVTYLDSALNQHNTVALTGHSATLMSVTADTSNGNIWVTGYSGGSAFSTCLSSSLVTVLALTQTITTQTGTQITSSATGGTLTIYEQVTNTYSFSSTRSDYIRTTTCTQAGTVAGGTIILRSAGLASKAFFYGTSVYLLVTYGGTNEPTYFLVDTSANLVGKLAPFNGVGYITGQVLPGVWQTSNAFYIGYAIRTRLIPTNKTQGATVSAPVFAQTGVNVASFNMSPGTPSMAEIGGSLHIAGAQMLMYDGTQLVEHSFHLYPEDLAGTTTTTTGSLSAQVYYYSAIYSWTDAQGNIHRSAPSIPLKVDCSGSGTSTNKNTVNIPTLRLTGKSNVRIELYRWSTAQQSYYLVSSVTAPTLNDKTVDSVQFLDTQADASIIGNALLYTTGGVLENIAFPAVDSLGLFDSRLFAIYSEDQYTAGFSKQIISGVPVEPSDLLAYFVPPTIGSQGNTGPLRGLAPLDDKLIFQKANALYYMNGTGPDNTGAFNQYSEPFFISSTVGTSLPVSTVLIPSGLIFQSDKGWWLLDRSLGTKYIGAPVEDYNSDTTLSSLAVPGTNQVRFTLQSGITLMYDYYYGKWATFLGIPGISSTLYKNLHTFVNSSGQVLQETPGLYVDGASPVLMGFTCAWMNFAGIQGYERAYFFYLLGEYLSPHKLNLSIAFDYNPSPSQSVLISPTNYAGTWGSDTLYGGSPTYGGQSSVEDWRVFLKQQKCKAFQISLQEVFDPSLGTTPGAGVALSGLTVVVGAKKSYAPRPSNYSTG